MQNVIENTYFHATNSFALVASLSGFNTRTRGGRFCPSPPFLQLTKKRRRPVLPGVGYLRINQEYILCANCNLLGKKFR